MNPRNGELHPILTKIESFFFPSRSRINRREIIGAHLRLVFVTMLLCLPALLLAIFPQLAIPMVLTSMTIIYSVYKIFGTYIMSRAAYYRLQDFNVAGKFAYQFLIFIICVEVGHMFCAKYNAAIASYIVNTSAVILVLYVLMLIFAPGTKGANAFGEQLTNAKKN